MKNKKQLIEFIKKSIADARAGGFDGLALEEDNESDGMRLYLMLYKGAAGTGSDIQEYLDAFYNLEKSDLKAIKEATKVKAIKIKEREDFGEWVKTLQITL